MPHTCRKITEPRALATKRFPCQTRLSPLGQHTDLYDFEADISEQKNVASDRPAIVERLKQKYLEWNRGNVSPNAKSTRGIPTVIDGVVVQLAF
jgi:hypothetical protein